MLPLALRKNTGSPLSKLLLIYLMARCPMPDGDALHSISPGSMIEFDEDEAARFCQVPVEDVYLALTELERLRYAYPCEKWLFTQSAKFTSDRDRWVFVIVALPLSFVPAGDRGRIKASDDQIDLMLGRQRYICATCGTHDDHVQSWHVDHIIPRSVGGADVEENCQAICSTCNSRKGAKVHWVDFLGGRR